MSLPFPPSTSPRPPPPQVMFYSPALSNTRLCPLFKSFYLLIFFFFVTKERCSLRSSLAVLRWKPLGSSLSDWWWRWWFGLAQEETKLNVDWRWAWNPRRSVLAKENHVIGARNWMHMCRPYNHPYDRFAWLVLPNGRQSTNQHSRSSITAFGLPPPLLSVPGNECQSTYLIQNQTGFLCW